MPTILQRGSAARGHRQQASDLAAKSRWRSQPATVTKARKLHPRAVQRSVSDQPTAGTNSRLDRNWGQRHATENIAHHLRRAAFLPCLNKQLGLGPIRCLQLVDPQHKQSATFYRNIPFEPHLVSFDPQLPNDIGVGLIPRLTIWLS